LRILLASRLKDISANGIVMESQGAHHVHKKKKNSLPLHLLDGNLASALSFGNCRDWQGMLAYCHLCNGSGRQA